MRTLSEAERYARSADRGTAGGVVPPTRFIDYFRSLEAILAEERTKTVIFGHAGDANAHVRPLVEVRVPDWRDRERRILGAPATPVARLGRTLSGVTVPLPGRDRLDVPAPWRSEVP